jgi:hypothetical protein
MLYWHEMPRVFFTGALDRWRLLWLDACIRYLSSSPFPPTTATRPTTWTAASPPPFSENLVGSSTQYSHHFRIVDCIWQPMIVFRPSLKHPTAAFPSVVVRGHSLSRWTNFACPTFSQCESPALFLVARRRRRRSPSPASSRYPFFFFPTRRPLLCGARR